MLRHMSGTPRRIGQRSRGFTLVELLVVVAIIALLISILLPSLQKARESAYSVKCLANEKSMGNAVALYQNDYNGMFPYGLESPAGDVNGTGDIGDGKPPQQLVFKYVKGSGIFMDPKAPDPDEVGYWWWEFNQNPDVDRRDCSYSFDEHGLWGMALHRDVPLADSNIKRPEQYGYMSGGNACPNGWGWWNMDPTRNPPQNLRLKWTHNGGLYDPSNPGHANFLFGDLHAGSVARNRTQQDVIRVPWSEHD